MLVNRLLSLPTASRDCPQIYWWTQGPCYTPRHPLTHPSGLLTK